MEPINDSLRDQLLAEHANAPTTLSRYRKDVDALLAQVRRRKSWMDIAHVIVTIFGVLILFPSAFLFGLMFLYLLASASGQWSAWLPAFAGLLCLAGAVALVYWFFRRRFDELLVEAKRLQAMGMELEEQLSPKDDPRLTKDETNRRSTK